MAGAPRPGERAPPRRRAQAATSLRASARSTRRPYRAPRTTSPAQHHRRHDGERREQHRYARRCEGNRHRGDQRAADRHLRPGAVVDLRGEQREERCTDGCVEAERDSCRRRPRRVRRADVARFQQTYTATTSPRTRGRRARAVRRSPSRSSRRSSPGQQGAFAARGARSSSASRTAYSVLREPRRSALAIPAGTEPPAPSTPTSANCEAPVNASSDSAQVCRTESPAVTLTAPNPRPYAPTATPIAAALRTMLARVTRRERRATTRRTVRARPTPARRPRRRVTRRRCRPSDRRRRAPAPESRCRSPRTAAAS